MHYDDPTFRPPYEIDSVLLQVTHGCSHNKCTFCMMYRDKTFAPSTDEEIAADIAEAAQFASHKNRVFLESGDAFCLPAHRLLDISEQLHDAFEYLDTITCYARIGNIATKTDEELRALAEADYSSLNIGVESALDDVLTFMNKGYDVDFARKQLERLNDAGISFSLNIINGAAGPDRRFEHAAANAKFCNDVQPNCIFVSPLHVDPGSPLEEIVNNGGFEESTLGQYIEEQEAMLRQLELDHCLYYGLHVSNPVPTYGYLPEDRDKLANKLSSALANMSDRKRDSHPVKGFEGRLV